MLPFCDWLQVASGPEASGALGIVLLVVTGISTREGYTPAKACCLAAQIAGSNIDSVRLERLDISKDGSHPELCITTQRARQRVSHDALTSRAIDILRDIIALVDGIEWRRLSDGVLDVDVEIIDRDAQSLHAWRIDDDTDCIGVRLFFSEVKISAGKYIYLTGYRLLDTSDCRCRCTLRDTNCGNARRDFRAGAWIAG